jgi:hypothetical protein
MYRIILLSFQILAFQKDLYFRTNVLQNNETCEKMRHLAAFLQFLNFFILSMLLLLMQLLTLFLKLLPMKIKIENCMHDCFKIWFLILLRLAHMRSNHKH